MRPGSRIASDSPFSPTRQRLTIVASNDEYADEETDRHIATTVEEALTEEVRSTSIRWQLWTITVMNAFPVLAIGTTLMSVMACAEGARITSMAMGIVTVMLLVTRSLTQRTLRAKARRIINRS